MPVYLHPGVYVEEIPSGSKPIEGVGTSTAAFVGYTTKGPIGEPELILKWDDYDTQYGGIRDTGLAEGDPMGFSVSAFFQNGGGKAYIVRITQDWNKDDSPPAFDAVKAVAYLDDPSVTGDHGLQFSAVNEGTWANGLVVRMAESQISSILYDVEIGRKNEDGELETQESFSNVSIDPAHPLYIEHVINGVSELVTVTRTAVAGKPITSGSYLGTSTSGDLTGVSLDFDTSGSFTDPLSRTLEISLDSEPVITKELSEKDFANLGEVASEIQQLVRGGASAERRANFTCEAVDDTLVFTSGTREADSSVVITSPSGAPTPNLVETLKLDVANGATQLTGQASADSAWSSSEPEDTLSGGVDGSQPLTDDYIDVFTKFLKYRDINIICLPGEAWASDGSGNPVIDAAIGHASKMKSRMVIVDPPVGTELEAPKDVIDLTLPSKTYSVLYYPWINVANPFYNAEKNPGALKTVLVPPSGFAAGMWAKIDGKRGVWKAPAGLESGLLGVAGLQYIVEDGEQDSLNPLGVNCLRKMPGAGRVIWGARTLATKADPEWRYVPVRRTAIMIEQSIYNGIQWAVFEPNDHRLWSALRGNIGGFMNSLFRVGAFQGEKASDAYFVRCGLGDTMTQTDIDAGQVIVIVGFAPLKPAEFVIVRIQQKVNQQ